MTPGEAITLIAFSIVAGIWLACLPPAEDREDPEYWGP